MPGIDAEFTSADPETVDVTSDTEGSFPIPDVKNLNFHEALAAHLEKNPDAVRRIDDDGPQEEEFAEEAPVRGRSKTTKVEAAPEEEAEPEKEIVKPWARARVLEKERNEKSEEVADLRQRLDLLTGMLQEQINARQEAPAEEEIDPEVDPVRAILKKMDGLEKKISRIEQGGEQAKHAITTTQVISDVNETMQAQLGTDPVFKEAVMHVATVMERSAAKKYPNLNENQRLAMVSDAINRTKLDWASRGADPIQETYEMAMTLGFDPDATEAKLKSQVNTATQKLPATSKTKPSPKEDIAARRQKEQSVSSIGGVEGGSPKPYDASTLSKAKNAEEFGMALDNMFKAGVLAKNNGRPGKTPDFATLLALAKGTKR